MCVITCPVPECKRPGPELIDVPIPYTDDTADAARCPACGHVWALDPGADGGAGSAAEAERSGARDDWPRRAPVTNRTPSSRLNRAQPSPHPVRGSPSRRYALRRSPRRWCPGAIRACCSSSGSWRPGARLPPEARPRGGSTRTRPACRASAPTTTLTTGSCGRSSSAPWPWSGSAVSAERQRTGSSDGAPAAPAGADIGPPWSPSDRTPMTATAARSTPPLPERTPPAWA